MNRILFFPSGSLCLCSRDSIPPCCPCTPAEETMSTAGSQARRDTTSTLSDTIPSAPLMCQQFSASCEQFILPSSAEHCGEENPPQRLTEAIQSSPFPCCLGPSLSGHTELSPSTNPERLNILNGVRQVLHSRVSPRNCNPPPHSPSDIAKRSAIVLCMTLDVWRWYPAHRHPSET